MTERITVLLLASDPAEFSSALRLDQEARAVIQAIRRARGQETLEVATEWAVRVSDVVSALLRHRPQIVHFAGHGTATPGIYLEDEGGIPRAVNREALASLFGVFRTVRVVVLNACEAGQIIDTFRDIVDYAVAIDAKISDAAAAVFTEAFYGALATGTTVKDAFALGVKRLNIMGMPDAKAPKLRIRAGVDPDAPLIARTAEADGVAEETDGSREPHERHSVEQCNRFDTVEVRGDVFISRLQSEEPPRVDFETTVWFATNRRPRVIGDARRGFGSARDDRTHYGCCKVFVPESHRIGELGSPLWHRVFHGDDRLKLLRTIGQEGSLTWRQIREALSDVPARSRHAVAFIHGYNVTFEGAALRAAQIGFDLQIPAMAFFSWPSQGQLRFYAPDEATIGASELAITEFLTRFATLHDSGAAVHVIAHSMGNRALLRAMERIVAKAEARSGKWFNQIILAAPDVDRDEFRQLAGVYAQACERTTLYVSDRDRALAGSKWVHQENRVGYSPPVTIVPGIDTVNVTKIDLSLLGHGYVAEAKEVLYDMHDLIFNGTEPDLRMALRSQRIPEGKYWEVKA